MPHADPLYDRLRGLGLRKAQARIYGTLLRRGPSTVADLASQVDLSQAKIEAALVSLTELGMTTRSDGEGPGTVMPLDPAAAVKILTARREAELTVAGRDTLRTYQRYLRNSPAPAGPDAIEFVSDEVLQGRVCELERSAAERIRLLDTPPYGAPTIDNPIELANLRRGVRYQVVYARASVQDARYFRDNIAPCTAAGEQARVVSTIPAKMMIVDDRAALVSLTAASADQHRNAILVRECGLLPALCALFASVWDRASLLSERGENADGLRHEDRRLLGLLAGGATDEVAARNLGISRRSVTRSVERLMVATGSTSRFELALNAARAGWL
ncbi:LuxR family transcriptional regulator [Amycolatopsis oliviviridis]|uniref:Transcriptional regulator n=1 Tax=Amycolatopsis oliviviridis TaxID=1471590 RepID=A0ABQ3L779_9PSEU|nr:helix-turn-helix domain-containing protein [Amycolatopsis oliviviridis]GHH06546.1 transcriptional regulator [Amycolatopsis oliviviridis]